MRLVRLFAIGLAVLGLWTACGKKQAETTNQQTAMTPVDWSQHGYPIVIDSALVPPNKVDTVIAGDYTFQVLEGTFNNPVKFEVLAGDTANFRTKAPEGELPILAFALKVTDTVTHQMVDKFNKPVLVIVTSPSISEQSKYYNVTMDGSYTANAAGMQVSNGQLEHPIDGTLVGWVITTPPAQAD